MFYKISDTQKAADLFAGWDETLIWSCIDKTMGQIYVNGLSKIESARAQLGDFCFCAGKPDKELAAFISEDGSQNFIIMVPQNEEWSQIIEEIYGDRAKRVTRYAIKKEENIFAEEKLLNIVEELPYKYELRLINQDIYEQCKANDWSQDLVSQYKDYMEYHELGLGAAILHHGELVAGASSYSRYKTGIEIEIDTRRDYRRKGLASVCGARLILECLHRNLYPSWDAQNLCSVGLAEKLGYHFAHEYTAYEVFKD